MECRENRRKIAFASENRIEEVEIELANLSQVQPEETPLAIINVAFEAIACVHLMVKSISDVGI